jgi:hypothetical protein
MRCPASLEAAKRGSITVMSLDAHFDRIAVISAENAGPEDVARKRLPRTATAKLVIIAVSEAPAAMSA